MARRRLEELSVLNVIFCLLVILIHVLSHAVVSLEITSWQYALVIVPQRLAFVSVPGFFYLSGVKLTLPRERPLPLRDYYLGRIKNIYLPYLLAAAVYYLFFVTIGWYTFSPAQFLRETALGTLSSPFYFLVALAQFILLAPLFQWLARRYHPALLIPLAMGLTWLSSMHFNSILQIVLPGGSFRYSDRIFTSYLIYYLTGCCVGAHYHRLPALLEENRSLLTAAALFFAGADGFISLLAFSGRRAAPYLELIHTLYILSAILALHGRAIRRGIPQGAPGRLLRATDRASYLIYLYHSLVITVFNIIAPRIVGGRVSVLLLLRILVVYPVSIAGCILWQRLWAGVKQSCLKRN